MPPRSKILEWLPCLKELLQQLIFSSVHLEKYASCDNSINGNLKQCFVTLENVAQELARRLGCRRRLRLVESGATRSPLAFGVVSPTIALQRILSIRSTPPIRLALRRDHVESRFCSPGSAARFERMIREPDKRLNLLYQVRRMVSTRCSREAAVPQPERRGLVLVAEAAERPR